MNIDLHQYLTNEFFAYAIVFCRIGSALMALPGLGDSFVSARIRLLLALAMCLLITPNIRQNLPAIPDSVSMLTMIAGTELLYGAFLGLIGRIIIGTMHTAGMIIATNSSLASAMLFDPNQSTQGTVVGNMLGMTAITLVFASDLYQQVILAFANSYDVFQVGNLDKFPDIAHFIVRLSADSFNLAAKISSPVIVVILLAYVTSGLLSRLMPAIQIFFIMVPVQIMVSLMLLIITLSGIYITFSNHFSAGYSGQIESGGF